MSLSDFLQCYIRHKAAVVRFARNCFSLPHQTPTQYTVTEIINSFGALFTGYLSGKFGRKPILLLSGVLYMIGSLIQCLVGIGTSEAVGLRVLYFSRFFAGLGVGMVSALVPSYVSECVPKSIRGRCTGMIQLANNIGIMLSCESLSLLSIADAVYS